MKNRSVQTRSFGLVEVFTVAVGLLAVAMVLYSIWFMSATLEQNGRLDKATDILRLKVSLAHLWFEEAIGGDQNINLDVQVYANIDEALALCRAMLAGGQTSMGQLQAINNGEAHASLTALYERLQLWRDFTAARWEDRRSRQPGSEREQVHDAVFDEIVQLSNEIDRTTNGILAWEKMVLTWVNRGVILCLFAIFVGITLVVRRSRRAIETKNAELEMRVQERTAGLFSEITERQRVEEALRYSEEYFRALIENALDIIVIVNADGTVRYQSPSGERVLGYRAEELIGKNAFDFIHPEDLPALLDAFTQGIQIPGHSASMEFRSRHKDGSWRYLEGLGTNLFENQAIRGVVVNSRDITERKRAEAELERLRHQQELILHSVADGIHVLDPQGKAIFVNPAAAHMIGYAVEELTGQSMHEVLHHSKPDGTPYPCEECPIYATLKDGNLHQAMDEVFWRRDGTSFPVEYISAPIREQGEIVGAVVTFRDISERRAIERMKDEFVSVVSHELRTPLTSIRGALGLLASGLIGALPEKGQRMLKIAVNNTDRLVRLINDILDAERIQSGKVTMQRQLCDAAVLLTQAVDEMRGMADKAGITLAVTPQPVQLWVDPDRIVQTLTNLLSNAIKFSSAGSTVWVSVAWQGEEALFTVRDQGRGIPADKLESIFERFQQVDASDSRKRGGTGLGLAICRSIIQQQGGRIWAESQLGVESTFYFTLPVWKEAEPVLTTVEGQPLVLMCDDDPGVLEVETAVLEQRGYQVVTVTTGREAVAQAEARQPAVILLDLLMPQMNGWDTMAALKRNPATRHIPIIIFSILSPPATTPLPPGCIDWVPKSLGEPALFEALKRALAERAKVAGVLVVEDDLDLAKVLIAMCQRHGIKTAHARTGREAIRACEQEMPDLLVLDLILPEGDGFMVADWLRQQEQLRQVPLVVYSVKDLDAGERERLQLGHTEFFTKGRITPEEFEQRVMSLLIRLVPNKGGNFNGRDQVHSDH